MTWDVTELVQFAIANGQSYLSVALMASDDETGTVTFTSVDGTTSERPWVNLTWSAGTGHSHLIQVRIKDLQIELLSGITQHIPLNQEQRLNLPGAILPQAALTTGECTYKTMLMIS